MTHLKIGATACLATVLVLSIGVLAKPVGGHDREDVRAIAASSLTVEAIRPQ
jgi:hypothetical protein